MKAFKKFVREWAGIAIASLVLSMVVTSFILGSYMNGSTYPKMLIQVLAVILSGAVFVETMDRRGKL